MENESAEGVPASYHEEIKSVKSDQSGNQDGGEANLSGEFECSKVPEMVTRQLEGEVLSNGAEVESEKRISRLGRARWQSNGQKAKSPAKSEEGKPTEHVRRPLKSERGEITLEQKLQVSPRTLSSNPQK